MGSFGNSPCILLKSLICTPGFEPGGREFESLRARDLRLTGHVAREFAWVQHLICQYLWPGADVEMLNYPNDLA